MSDQLRPLDALEVMLAFRMNETQATFTELSNAAAAFYRAVGNLAEPRETEEALRQLAAGPENFDAFFASLNSPALQPKVAEVAQKYRDLVEAQTTFKASIPIELRSRWEAISPQLLDILSIGIISWTNSSSSTWGSSNRNPRALLLATFSRHQNQTQAHVAIGLAVVSGGLDALLSAHAPKLRSYFPFNVHRLMTESLMGEMAALRGATMEEEHQLWLQSKPQDCLKDAVDRLRDAVHPRPGDAAWEKTGKALQDCVDEYVRGCGQVWIAWGDGRGALAEIEGHVLQMRRTLGTTLLAGPELGL